MTTGKKTALVVAASLLVLGIGLVGVAVALGGTQVVKDSVSINLGTADIGLLQIGGLSSGLRLFKSGEGSEAPESGKYDSAEGDYTEITIGTVSQDITVVRSDDEAIHASYEQSEHMKFEISDRDGSFSLTAKSRGSSFFGSGASGPVTVSVPHSFEGKLVLGTVSGDIEVCAFDELDRLQCDSVSGKIRFEAVSAEKIMCDTVSGDIEGTLRGSESDWTVKADTVSGDMPAKRTGGTREVMFNTVSGDGTLTFTP
ncbi:MAG: hypothetical protein ABT01_01180 [Clostridium sp. SCN 57-10]|nr:MAG: hypothetical protein ABT01_01180 [Clostridium sp. SCN 57-10]